jgi:hypothetical protein
MLSLYRNRTRDLEPLKEVGLVPGISLYFSGVKVRKTQPIEGFDIACKCSRKYRGVSVKRVGLF